MQYPYYCTYSFPSTEAFFPDKKTVSISMARSLSTEYTATRPKRRPKYLRFSSLDSGDNLDSNLSTTVTRLEIEWPSRVKGEDNRSATFSHDEMRLRSISLEISILKRKLPLAR